MGGETGMIEKKTQVSSQMGILFEVVEAVVQNTKNLIKAVEPGLRAKPPEVPPVDSGAKLPEDPRMCVVAVSIRCNIKKLENVVVELDQAKRRVEL